VGGVGSLISGVGQLGGSVFHDVLKAGTEAVTLGKADWGGGYQTDEIATNLIPAIGHDLAERYGSLSPFDDRPASEFFQQLYDKPVSFGLDALVAAGAAAKGAGIAGQAAIKGTDALATAERVTAALEDVGVATRTAKAAGIRGALDDLAKAGDTGLAQTLKPLLPSETFKRVGETLKPAATSYNPLVRAMKGVTFGKVGTEPIARLAAEVQDGLAHISELSIKDRNLLNQRQLLLQKALDEGLHTVETAKVGEFRASNLGRTINKVTSGSWFRERLRAVGAEKEIWQQAKNVATPEEWQASSALAMGADVMFTDLALDPKIAARIGREVGDYVKPATLLPEPQTLEGAGGVATAIATKPLLATVSETARQALEGDPYLARVDAVMTKLDEFKQRLTDNAEGISQLNPDFDVTSQIEAANRMADHFAHDAELRMSASPIIKAVGEQRLLDVEKMSKLWDNYAYTPEQMLAESYRPSQVMHGAEVTIGDGPNVSGPEWRAFDDAFRNIDHHAPAYYPHIANTQKSGFDWFMPRKRIGAVTFAKDPHLNFNTETLFKRGNYIHDPIEAYARRAARGVRMDGTVRMINAYLEQAGRPITNADQLATGEVVMSPSMVFLRKQLADKFQSTAEDMMLKGLDESDAWTAAFHQTTRAAQDEIVSKLAEAGGIKMYAVPEIVAKHMNDAAKWAQIIPGGARIYVDGPMNVWRSLVLAGSPRWIVNNVLGNVTFSVMQGAPVGRAFHILEQRFKRVVNEKYGLKMKTGLLDETEKALEAAGIRDQVALGGYNRIEELTPQVNLGEKASQTAVGKFVNRTREAPGRTLNRFQKIGHGVRSFNSEIEAAFRENSFLPASERALGISTLKRTMGRFERSHGRFERILKDGLTESQAKAALNEVNHFLGDFMNLGPFERNIARRFIAPFWGFYKFQSKLFLSFPFEYPLRASVLQQLVNVTEELSAAYGPRPEWLRSAVPLGPPGSEVKFLTTAGPNPFSGLMQNPLSQLSPLIKIPLEYALGRSTFTGDRFSDANTYTPFGSDQSFDIQTGEPVSAPRPGIIESTLGQIPQYDLLKELIAGGKTYDTANIIEALKGNAALTDAEGQTKYPTSIADLLTKFLGVPQTTYNLGAYQESLEEGKQAALREALRRAG